MNTVKASARPQADKEITSASVKAAVDGNAIGPSLMTLCAKTTATTAEDREVPTERISALRPLAAAVSVTGTAPMISAGIAA